MENDYCIYKCFLSALGGRIQSYKFVSCFNPSSNRQSNNFTLILQWPRQTYWGQQRWRAQDLKPDCGESEYKQKSMMCFLLCFCQKCIKCFILVTELELFQYLQSIKYWLDLHSFPQHGYVYFVMEEFTEFLSAFLWLTAFTHRPPKEAGPHHLGDSCVLGSAIMAGHWHLCSVRLSGWLVFPAEIIFLSFITTLPGLVTFDQCVRCYCT